jgi:anti-sigma regulatory factor (Ser/Thr protein kinase)
LSLTGARITPTIGERERPIMAQQQGPTGTTVAGMGLGSTHPRPARFPAPLPDAPDRADVVTFDRDSFGAVREHVGTIADQAGLAGDRGADLVLAVHEIATNSVRHGGGRGELRVWVDGPRVVCEVRDDGRLGDPSAVSHRPASTDSVGGRGLWIAKQLCDRVHVSSSEAGTVVRLQQRVG